MSSRAAHGSGQDAHAVITGTAVNQDGRSSSLTAPNGPSQQALISSCLRDADAAPTAVGYTAVHGTGTPLGDPIEVGALAGALGATSTGRSTALTLGSVKVSLVSRLHGFSISHSNGLKYARSC